MKLKFTILCVVLGLQASWIVGTTFVQENVLRHGTMVLLETRPVDPRDLLRGDYLILNYKISDIPLKLFTPAITNPPAGQEVYVALRLTNTFYEVAQASTKPFVPQAGQVLVKGRTSKWWWGGNTNSVHVDYGLERFYVREKTGNPRGKITVQAAVSGSGHCLIRQVFLDGKPYAEAMKAESSENLR